MLDGAYEATVFGPVSAFQNLSVVPLVSPDERAAEWCPSCRTMIEQWPIAFVLAGGYLGFGSDVSRVEDPVQGTLVRPVLAGDTEALPAGSTVTGYVSSAVRPGRVKGRGRVSVRFTELRRAGGEHYGIRTRPWTAVAPATKKQDALTIGAPAAGGAIVGGILGGKKGAGIGALAGGGGGTAVVLTTRGKDVRVGRGATLAVRLSAPLRVRVSSRS